MASTSSSSAASTLARVGVLWTLMICPGAAQAQIAPLGPAFTLDQGQWPRAAIDSRGRFMVVWDRDNTAFAYAQIFDETGLTVAERFRAAVPKKGGYLAVAETAVDDSGSFLLVWQYQMRVTNQSGIAARFYGPLGEPQSTTFFLAPEEPQVFKWNSRVARSPGGDAVVVWEERERGDGRYLSSTLRAQRFNSRHRPAGETFTVRRAPGEFLIFSPLVAMEDSGRFSVVWSEDSSTGLPARFFLQRFRRNGEKRGNRKLLLRRDEPVVFAMDPSGDLVAVWRDEGLVLRGRWFDPAGRPQGGTVAVDGEKSQDVGFVVAKDAFGNTIVLWTERAPRTPTAPLFGRLFDRTGVPVGEALDLGPGRFPSSLVVNRDGTLVVVWMEPFDRRHTQVVARRFELSCAPGYEHRCRDD